MMDRREFVKMLGAGGLLVGLAAIAGSGCAKEEEVVTPDPMNPPGGEPPPAEPGEAAPPAEPAGEEEQPPAEEEEGESEAAVEGDQAMIAICPDCGAENEVKQWSVEIACWKCGHRWTPQKPA